MGGNRDTGDGVERIGEVFSKILAPLGRHTGFGGNGASRTGPTLHTTDSSGRVSQQARPRSEHILAVISSRRLLRPAIIATIASPRSPFGRHSRHMASGVGVAAAVASPPHRVVTVAAIQFQCSADLEANCRKAEALIRDAARKGANVILLQELFASLYFPIDQMECMRLAVSIEDDKSYILRFQSLARELSVVIPLSFYERSKYVLFALYIFLFFPRPCTFDMGFLALSSNE